MTILRRLATRFGACAIVSAIAAVPLAVRAGGSFGGYVILNNANINSGANQFYDTDQTTSNPDFVSGFTILGGSFRLGGQMTTFPGGGGTNSFDFAQLRYNLDNAGFVNLNLPFARNVNANNDDQWEQLPAGGTELGSALNVGAHTLSLYFFAQDNNGTSGTTQIGSAGSPYTASFTVNAGTFTWDGGGANGNTSNALNWQNDVAPGNGHNLVFAGNTQTAVNNQLSSVNSLNFTGPGGFNIGGAALNIAAGGISNTSGSTQQIAANLTMTAAQNVSSNAFLSINGAVNLNGFRMTVTGSGGETALTNIVSGSGASNILKQGSTGVLTLGSVAGPNTFSSTGNHNIFIDAGTVQMAQDGAGGTTNGLSTGWIDLGSSNAGSAGNSFLFIQNQGVTIANPIDVRKFSGVTDAKTIGLSHTGANVATFSGGIALHDNLTLSAAGSSTLRFTGPIANGDAAGLNNQTTGQIGLANPSITKTGTGTVEFRGTTSYTGATNVNQGVLLVTGKIGAGSVNVGSATPATLAGTGTITASSVNVGANGTIAPGFGGNSIARFNINVTGSTTVFAGGGTYAWEVNHLPFGGTEGVNWDLLSLNALNISATGGSRFTIKVISLNAAGTAPGSLSGLTENAVYTWRILNKTPTAFDPSVFTIDASAFSSDAEGVWSIIQDHSAGLDVQFTVSAVPEPSILAFYTASLLIGRRYSRSKR
jgi:autotransporter-associated beta strand protein